MFFAIFLQSMTGNSIKTYTIMAAITLILDTRTARKDGTCPLKLRISHNSSPAYIGLGIYLKPSQWDCMSCKAVGNAPNRSFVNEHSAKMLLSAQRALLELQDTGGLRRLTAAQLRDKIAAAISPDKKKADTGSFVEHYRKFMGEKEKPRTREIYEYTLSRLYKYCPQLDSLAFEDITKDWLQGFDRFMEQTSPSRNARNIHLRNIRAVFNDAIDDEKTAFYPFRKLKIRPEATPKRSLSAEQLRTLFSYPVEAHQRQYLDMFKLIFCLIGINIIDLCNLKASDYYNGRITYRRAKTGRLYDIKVEPEAAEIIAAYPGNGWLLDILDRYRNYKDYAHRMNDNLRGIGEVRIVGQGGRKEREPLFPQITTYWARHSWATIAASLDIPKETISEALGHEIGSRVTSIYIDFDRRKVDEANRRVLDWVFYGKR